MRQATPLCDRDIRREERTRTVWRNGVLTTKVAERRILVRDAFARSTAETITTLLSVREADVLIAPSPLHSDRQVRARREVRAIFTSNPDEHAGVQAARNALFGRMITFDVSCCVSETEAGIVACRTGVGRGGPAARGPELHGRRLQPFAVPDRAAGADPSLLVDREAAAGLRTRLRRDCGARGWRGAGPLPCLGFAADALDAAEAA